MLHLRKFTRKVPKFRANSSALFIPAYEIKKGYDEVLALACRTFGRNIHYHFAGGWQSAEDESYFYDFVEQNNLNASVTYHGFVDGAWKGLFKSSLLAYQS